MGGKAKVFVERGVSGSKPLVDRPQGTALLATLKPGDAVITPSSTVCSAVPSMLSTCWAG